MADNSFSRNNCTSVSQISDRTRRIPHSVSDSVSDDWHMNVAVYGRAHPVPTCGLHLLWLQIDTEHFVSNQCLRFICLPIYSRTLCGPNTYDISRCIRNKSGFKPFSTSWKYTYIILTPLSQILYSKTGLQGHILFFLISTQKHRLWVLVRTASARWSNEYSQSNFLSEIWK